MLLSIVKLKCFLSCSQKQLCCFIFILILFWYILSLGRESGVALFWKKVFTFPDSCKPVHADYLIIASALCALYIPLFILLFLDNLAPASTLRFICSANLNLIILLLRKYDCDHSSCIQELFQCNYLKMLLRLNFLPSFWFCVHSYE